MFCQLLYLSVPLLACQCVHILKASIVATVYIIVLKSNLLLVNVGFFSAAPGSLIKRHEVCHLEQHKMNTTVQK